MINTVTSNSGNYNLIGRVCCYDTCNYNLIIAIQLSLYCLLDIQRSRITF